MPEPIANPRPVCIAALMGADFARRYRRAVDGGAGGDSLRPALCSGTMIGLLVTALLLEFAPTLPAGATFTFAGQAGT